VTVRPSSSESGVTLSDGRSLLFMQRAKQRRVIVPGFATTPTARITVVARRADGTAGKSALSRLAAVRERG
jgi:hypothetical protein